MISDTGSTPGTMVLVEQSDSTEPHVSDGALGSQTGCWRCGTAASWWVRLDDTVAVSGLEPCCDGCRATLGAMVVLAGPVWMDRDEAGRLEPLRAGDDGDGTCNRCAGRSAHLVALRYHDGALSGRLLRYCEPCRASAGPALALCVPLTVLRRDPESFLLLLYQHDLTRSDPAVVAALFTDTHHHAWVRLAQQLLESRSPLRP